MNRRDLLAIGTASVFVGVSGCLDESNPIQGENGDHSEKEGNSDQSEGGECPTCPDSIAEGSVSYEEHDVTVYPKGEFGKTGARLVTSDPDAEEVTPANSNPPEPLQNINFDEAFGIAIHAGTGGADTEFHLLGVDMQSDNSSIDVATCIKRFDGNDAYSAYERLLIVSHNGDVPETVSLKNYTPGPPEGWMDSSTQCQ